MYAGVCLLFFTSCGKAEKKSEDQPIDTAKVEEETDKNVAPIDSNDPKNTTEKTDNISSITPVVLFLGGYTSCPRNSEGNEDPRTMDLISMFDGAKAGVADISGLNETRYLLSCYGFDPESISYVLSSDPDKVRFKKVADMEADFAKLIKDLPNLVIFVTGHSYGAYTALKLISGAAKETTFAGLVTLDAISKVGCTPANALPAILGGTPVPKECLEAPADINTEEQKLILSKSPTWLNYYQTDSIILHSSEFASAQNFKMHYEGTGINPHMDVLYDEAVENSVVDLIVTKTKAAAEKAAE